MDNILNKSYKRIGATDSDVFVPKSIDNEFVIFSNGARCKIMTLLSDFEEIPTESLIEGVELIPNADTFFNSKVSENDILLQQVEQLATKPHTIIEPSEKLQESSSLDDDRFEKITPGSSKQEQNINRLNLGNDDDLDAPIPKDKPTAQVINNRVPEYDVFDKVKLSEEIEITVPFKIKLPRADKLDLLNDMFNISFTAYLAKKYINDNIVNNSVKLQTLIKDAIENWMDDELSSSPKKSKPKKSKKNKEDIIEPEIVKPEIVKSEPIIEKPEDTATSFFGKAQTGPAWDGDIKKLFLITSDEQYNAVKKRFISLKDNNINNGEVDRLEDMLQIYEETIK